MLIAKPQPKNSNREILMSYANTNVDDRAVNNSVIGLICPPWTPHPTCNYVLVTEVQFNGKPLEIAIRCPNKETRIEANLYVRFTDVQAGKTRVYDLEHCVEDERVHFTHQGWLDHCINLMTHTTNEELRVDMRKRNEEAMLVPSLYELGPVRLSNSKLIDSCVHRRGEFKVESFDLAEQVILLRLSHAVAPTEPELAGVRYLTLHAQLHLIAEF